MTTTSTINSQVQAKIKILHMNVCLVWTLWKVQPSKRKKAEAKPKNRTGTKASSGLSCKTSTIPYTRKHTCLLFIVFGIFACTKQPISEPLLGFWLGLYARTYASLRFHVHHFWGLTQLIFCAVLFASSFLSSGRAKWCCVYTSSFVFLLPMLVMCFYPRFTFFYSHCCVLSLSHTAPLFVPRSLVSFAKHKHICMHERACNRTFI